MTRPPFIAAVGQNPAVASLIARPWYTHPAESVEL